MRYSILQVQKLVTVQSLGLFPETIPNNSNRINKIRNKLTWNKSSNCVKEHTACAWNSLMTGTKASFFPGAGRDAW